jgi:hypothetical protein
MALGRKTGGKRRGSPKTGGRRAGTPNKFTVVKAEAMAEAVQAQALTEAEIATITPLDALLYVLRRYLVAHDWHGAIQAASAAAPYVHYKLSASDVRIRHEVGGLSDEQIAAERQLLLTKRQATERVVDAVAEPVLAE